MFFSFTMKLYEKLIILYRNEVKKTYYWIITKAKGEKQDKNIITIQKKKKLHFHSFSFSIVAYLSLHNCIKLNDCSAKMKCDFSKSKILLRICVEFIEHTKRGKFSQYHHWISSTCVVFSLFVMVIISLN